MSNSEQMEKALELSAEDRAELARRLILSLDSAPPDPGADQAWEQEINRRLAALDCGEVKLVDWRESVERARCSLAKDQPK